MEFVNGFRMTSHTVYEMENTLWWTNSLLLKMAIEIVDFPIKNGGSFHWYVSSPEGNIAMSETTKQPDIFKN